MKNIIAMVGETGSGRKTAANALRQLGFYRISIAAKVEEFACRLFSKEEIEKSKPEIIKEVRKRGFRVSPNYWFNLILIDIPDNKGKIVFDDVEPDEIVNSNVIKFYHILRPNIPSSKLPNAEIINNGATKEAFIKEVQRICGK